MPDEKLSEAEAAASRVYGITSAVYIARSLDGGEIYERQSKRERRPPESRREKTIYIYIVFEKVALALNAMTKETAIMKC